MLPELITSCYGKKYRDERAVISLTSWKARINTVAKTIYNLFTVCPGFHICLVLAEDEFPRKEAELPKHLIMMANANMFEILWVKQNWKSFKKWLFTAQKYQDMPIISADDDCIYHCNYASLLYEQLSSTDPIIVTNRGNYSTPIKITRGPDTLFYKFPVEYALSKLISFKEPINNYNDDAYYATIINLLNLKVVDLNLPPFYHCHDAAKALSESQQYDIIQDSLYFTRVLCL